MNKVDMLKALDDGKKVRHYNFSKDEWMKKTGHNLEFEDGIQCSLLEFWTYRPGKKWNEDWTVIE